ncbi:hypothetical protein EN866_32925 [Mesorhizobium sp. M2D.F.Ca.ET.223.01.1.1]|uniref:hypothetical protein n=1 Tax=Mesorhizobium sp. M2D.F.Ca.ET.223.01.1.1 TaxID=2563940 RepID=UPI001091EF1F|nr:hypothetical protein [Mesorhizobium sp. M2D.F.Ca.ET.223.01.1.1]TGR84612.1 hypothetical protein EN866_32925 [Mesorhizobium sp. M2D.F.Ca.ET.223.01.1.1]TGT64503.1 hypothetical protein EN802_32460 [bacterium M00.F.Ca.ET.159.01.1.1]TGT79348.1 hypothetical protein EN800_31800 [bacterium M00.F.Ca.ET.157.01.1.1]
MPQISVARVLASDVDKFWPHIAQGMHRSCVKSGGQLSAGYLWQECRGDRAFLYIVHDEDGRLHGSAVFAFREWPSGLRYVGLGLCGLNASDWFEILHNKVREDARMGGAVAIVDAARPGMRKFYKAKTIKMIQVVYEERL